MLRTRMFSDSPGMPGRSAQIPRTHKSTGTPACDARYSASMIASSTSALHLIRIRAGRPAAGCSASRRSARPARRARRRARPAAGGTRLRRL